MMQFGTPRSPRRPSLTPMIDVVFLLLVFFMLIARFGLDSAIPVRLAGAGDYSGPPRLVDVAPGTLSLNGIALPARSLLLELDRLTDSGDDIVVLRPVDRASLQRLVETMELFEAAGFANLAVVEGS